MHSRAFTPQQAQIALLISDRRALSYAQIGELLQPRLKKRTVKAYVRQMCERVDDPDSQDAFPPRVQIMTWMRQLEWELKHEPTLEEVIRSSVLRDV